MEGPSLVILTEELAPFKGKKILAVSGNTKQDKERLLNKTIKDIRSWGKHLLLVFNDFSVRIHFLMFGSYRINESKENSSPRLSLEFKNGEINFYACSVKFIEGDINDVYDWSGDIMNPQWDAKKALKKIKNEKEEQVCDVLMDQDIFAGVGNIIKNEVLYNLKIHPETKVKDLKPAQIKALIQEAQDYSNNFYNWKKEFQLKKHWKLFRKKTCPLCGMKVTVKRTGKRERLSYFCQNCQRP